MRKKSFLQTPPLLYRYVIREVAAPFLLALFVFTGILFLARILKLVDLVINKGVPVGEMIQLFLLVIPQFLEFAVPMALLLGVVLGIGRLSASSELVVMRAMGISLRQLLRPVMFFTVVASLASFLLAFYLRPWSNYQLNLGLFEIAKQRASAGLVPGVFNDFGALTIYAEVVADGGHHLKNVLISDRRSEETPRTFLAKFGQISSDASSRDLTLNLYDGSIQEGRGDDYNVTKFDVNNIVLTQSELVDDITREGKKPSEMIAGELSGAMAVMNSKPLPLGQRDQLRKARYEVEYHRRWVLPTACPLIALIALALGVQPARSGKTWGAALNITAGIVAIGVYYLLLAFSTAMGEQAVLPPWGVMWIPNVVFGVVALYFFRKMESEQWLAVSQAVGDAIGGFFSRVLRRIGSGGGA